MYEYIPNAVIASRYRVSDPGSLAVDEQLDRARGEQRAREGVHLLLNDNGGNSNDNRDDDNKDTTDGDDDIIKQGPC